MLTSGPRALAALAIVWALVTAGAALRAARALPPDPMARLEAEFRELAVSLPTIGEVGYLERYADEDAADEVQRHYAAQYALAPRIVRRRTGQEFLIVAAGTARPGGDSRLDDYAPVASTPAGHRVFRRFAR